jgi:hypothetical protein
MAVQKCTKTISERFNTNIWTGKVFEATFTEECLLRRITLREGVLHLALCPIFNHMPSAFEKDLFVQGQVEPELLVASAHAVGFSDDAQCTRSLMVNLFE